jgi:hypothetical protein
MKKVFSSQDEAISYAIEKTGKTLTKTDLENRIVQYEGYISQSTDSTDIERWGKNIEDIKNILGSDDFKNGNYPTGIDDLLFLIFEYRSMIYAFSKVDFSIDPFQKYPFFQQWLNGAVYVIFTNIGKLVSKDERDNSLRSLWNTLLHYIKDSDLANESEIEHLCMCLDDKNGHFTNEKSKAILFRNKYIAHNECIPVLKWTDIDADIEILSRMWSVSDRRHSRRLEEAPLKGAVVIGPNLPG